MKLEFSQRIFKKSSNIKFHENPSSGRRDVPCGRTVMTKPVVAFHNFADEPKKRPRQTSVITKWITFLSASERHLSHTANTTWFTSSGVEWRSQVKSAEHSPSGAFALLSCLDIKFVPCFHRTLGILTHTMRLACLSNKHTIVQSQKSKAGRSTVDKACKSTLEIYSRSYWMPDAQIFLQPQPLSQI
jgi:hypothetical protein